MNYYYALENRRSWSYSGYSTTLIHNYYSTLIYITIHHYTLIYTATHYYTLLYTNTLLQAKLVLTSLYFKVLYQQAILVYASYYISAATQVPSWAQSALWTLSSSEQGPWLAAESPKLFLKTLCNCMIIITNSAASSRPQYHVSVELESCPGHLPWLIKLSGRPCRDSQIADNW